MSLAESTHLDLRKNGPKSRRGVASPSSGVALLTLSTTGIQYLVGISLNVWVIFGISNVTVIVHTKIINKFIGKIKVIGNILVGKKKGEGVFGVSFKIKGPPKNLKTTVNPIKTLTPRFITRTLEKIKKSNQ